MLSLSLQNCFSYLDFFANLFRFCCSWRQLLHLISPSARQRFCSWSIGMPRREFFSPRTTLTSGGFFSGTGHSCLSLLARLHQSSQRARSLGRWMVAPRSSIAASSGTSLSYFFSSFFPCLLNLPSNTSMRNRYIVCELIAKKALGLHALPAFLQSYLDDSSEVFMYSAEHVSSFGTPHLRGGAWYLDCRPGFTPPGEEALFSSLSSIAPIEAVPEEEEAARHPHPFLSSFLVLNFDMFFHLLTVSNVGFLLRLYRPCASLSRCMRARVPLSQLRRVRGSRTLDSTSRGTVSSRISWMR